MLQARRRAGLVRIVLEECQPVGLAVVTRLGLRRAGGRQPPAVRGLRRRNQAGADERVPGDAAGTVPQCRIARDGERLDVAPLPWTGSSDLVGLAVADGLVALPAGGRADAGTKVEVLPFGSR